MGKIVLKISALRILKGEILADSECAINFRQSNKINMLSASRDTKCETECDTNSSPKVAVELLAQQATKVEANRYA